MTPRLCGDKWRKTPGESIRLVRRRDRPSWRICHSCMFSLCSGLTVEQLSKASDLACWNDYACHHRDDTASLKRRSATACGSWRGVVRRHTPKFVHGRSFVAAGPKERSRNSSGSATRPWSSCPRPLRFSKSSVLRPMNWGMYFRTAGEPCARLRGQVRKSAVIRGRRVSGRCDA
jgi:hypothetical protein